MLIEHLQKNTGDDQIVRSIEFINRFIIPNLGCYMAKMGELELIKELRKFNADLNLPDYDGRTLLHLAVSEKQMEIIKYLIEEAKVDINPLDHMGCTPMYDVLLQRNKKLLYFFKYHSGKIKAP